MKHGGVFERPWLVRDFPIAVCLEGAMRRFEIRFKVGAEAKLSVRFRSRRNGGEEGRTEDAVLVMPNLWPRVGKQYEDLGDFRARRNGAEKKAGLGVNEVEVGESGAVALPRRAGYSVAHDINPQANL